MEREHGAANRSRQPVAVARAAAAALGSRAFQDPMNRVVTYQRSLLTPRVCGRVTRHRNPTRERACRRRYASWPDAYARALLPLCWDMRPPSAGPFLRRRVTMPLPSLMVRAMMHAPSLTLLVTIGQIGPHNTDSAWLRPDCENIGPIPPAPRSFQPVGQPTGCAHPFGLVQFYAGSPRGVCERLVANP